MPLSIQVRTPPTLAEEPISLALLNAVLRLDLDPAQLAGYAAGTVATTTPGTVLLLDAPGTLVAYGTVVQAVAESPELEHLGLLVSSARELVEGYTGGYYAPQTLDITYRVDEEYLLPPGGVAVSVSGFYATLTDLDNRNNYLVEYQKGISVNRQLDLGEALNQTYTVQVAIAAPPVPSLVRSAILELAGEWYRNRETTLSGVNRLTELPVNWKVKLAPLRRTVLSAY